MGTIRALLVGIDDYPAAVAGPLGGCGNDIAEVRRLLTDLAGAPGALDVLVLTDAEATVAAVEEAVVRHLGAAGDGDAALLWFSGHGTELLATGDDLLVEATGRNQALVCVDGPLLDKRLGALLERVAAGGARVTAVLDCCQSGGATREVTRRFTPPKPGWTADTSTHGASTRDTSGGGASAHDTSGGEASARDTSGGDASAHDTSAGEASPCDASAHDASAGGASAHDTPAGETSTRDTSGGKTSTRDTSGGKSSAHDTSGGEASARDTSGGEASAHDASAGEASPCDASPCDASAGETSAHYASAGETSARDTEAGETSTRDTSGGKNSAHDTSGGETSTRDASGGSAVRHLLLAASRLDQPSYEGWYDGRRHGAFTHALIGAVRAAEPGATGRELLAAAAARVRLDGRDQRPVLYPDLPGGPADRPFLGEAPTRALSPHLLRFAADGWEVDCGSGHGLREGAGAEGTEFTIVDDARSAGLVLRVREVRMDRTVVDPVGWAPDRERVYPVALSALALPPAAVAIEGSADAVRELTEAVSTSPLLRVADGPAGAAGPHFRVRVAGGAAEVLRQDGTAFTEPLPYGGGGDAWHVVDCLAHLTRWHQLRDLTPRPSLLDGLVRLEVAPWGAGPGEALRPDATGELVCPYTPGPDGPQSPRLSIRIHNHSPDRTLWCLLVDLTDRYASHTVLYPGHFIGPGRTGHALDGDAVHLSLPRGRPVVPGAESLDWLRLIVAEGELNTVPFRLPEWGSGTWSARGDLDGVLRLDPGHRGRDLGPAEGGGPGRWTALTVPLRTVVPRPAGPAAPAVTAPGA